MLTAMGFEVEAAEAALTATGARCGAVVHPGADRCSSWARWLEGKKLPAVRGSRLLWQGRAATSWVTVPAKDCVWVMLLLCCAVCCAGGSVERAADWLFSHMDDLQAAIAAVKGGAGGAGAAAGAGADAGGAAASSR